MHTLRGLTLLALVMGVVVQSVPAEEPSVGGATGAAPDTAVWESWLNRKLIPADKAQDMLRAFVEKQIHPLPLPRTLDEWKNQREPLRQEILRLRGIGEMRSGKGGLWPSMAGEPWSSLLVESDASWSNWSWFAGRPVPGQWALDTVQVARFGCDQFKVKSVSIEADNDFGWSSLLAGAVEPDLITSGNARIRRESQQDDIRTRGDRALADVPGLLERLDIQHIRKLWPGQVTVQR